MSPCVSYTISCLAIVHVVYTHNRNYKHFNEAQNKLVKQL